MSGRLVMFLSLCAWLGASSVAYGGTPYGPACVAIDQPVEADEGELVVFSIETRDINSQAIDVTNCVYSVQASGPGQAELSAPMYVSNPGLYEFTFSAAEAGTYSVAVALQSPGSPGDISGSPFEIEVVGVVGNNDPPVHGVPGTQYTLFGLTPVIFSAQCGNAVTTSDPDAGAADVQVTLSATNGRLTLGSTAGVSFAQGDGQNDSSMAFQGSLASVNSALDGLRYRPHPLMLWLLGQGSVTITTDDLGNTGSGGPMSDTDTVIILRIP